MFQSTSLVSISSHHNMTSQPTSELKRKHGEEEEFYHQENNGGNKRVYLGANHSSPFMTSLPFLIPSLELKLFHLKDIPSFHAVIHIDHAEQLFPNSNQDDLYVRIRSYIYKVIWSQQPSMKGQIWVDYTTPLEDNSSNLVTPFYPMQNQSPVGQIALRLNLSPQFKSLIYPFPVSIPVIEDLCRKTLTGIFFNSCQNFEIVYHSTPLTVQIGAMATGFGSVTDAQQIGEKTKVRLSFSEEKLLLGTFHFYPSKGRVFTFEIVKFENPFNQQVKEKGYFIKDWAKEELRNLLPQIELMRNTAFKISITAPINYFQSLMTAKVRLAHVTTQEEGESDRQDGLYTFDQTADYEIDFIPPAQELNIDMVEKIVKVSNPVTVKILDWKDDKFLCKGGLTVVQFSKQEILSALEHACEYISLRKLKLTTGLGTFIVEFSIEGHSQSDVLYQLQSKEQISVKSEAANLMVHDTDLMLNIDDLWKCYIKEQLKIKKIGGLSTQTTESLIRFIQTIRESLDPDFSAKRRPSPVLLISGPFQSGKKFLATFVKNMFSPILTQQIDAATGKTMMIGTEVNSKNPMSHVSPQKRGVIQIFKIEECFTNTAVQLSPQQWTMSIMDMIQKSKNMPGMILIATTSDISKIPPEIVQEFGVNCIDMGLPTREERHEFFQLLTQEDYLPLKDVNFEALSEMTTGFPRKILYDLVRLPQEKALSVSQQELTQQDFEEAFEKLKSFKRSGPALNYYL